VFRSFQGEFKSEVQIQNLKWRN